MRDAIAHSIAALLLLIFALRAFDLARTYGPTFDETAHLGAGISYVQTHDYRLNAEHPALPKLLAGWFATRTGVKGAYESVAWMRSEQWDFARETIYQGGADWREVLTWGRMPMIFIGVALGLILWMWSRSLLGNEGALLVLFLFTFCPNMVAHTALVTTDVPLTCAVVGATASLWCAYRTGQARWVLAGAFCFAVAMVTKYSAFSYFPVLVLLAFWPSALRPMRKSISHGVLFAFAGMVLTVALVFVTYAGAHDWTSIESLGMRGRGIDARELGFLQRATIGLLARIPWPSADFARGFKDI
ncbi:MAG TPA: glycosyltransferase family 39 protein, partial [bacterium]|nr:glycosyltransferase family 39 protein [bacterium]